MVYPISVGTLKTMQRAFSARFKKWPAFSKQAGDVYRAFISNFSVG